jgi:hypothetical protein
MGAVLGTKVSGYITDGLTDAGVDPSALGSGGSTSIPDLSTVPGPIRTIIESAYGQGVADVFLIAAPLAVITIVFVCLLPNVELGTKTGIQRAAASGDGAGAAGSGAAGAGAAAADPDDASAVEKGVAATAGLAPSVSSAPASTTDGASTPAPTSPVDQGDDEPVVDPAGTGRDTRTAPAAAAAGRRHHSHATTGTGTIDTIIATGAAEVAGHPVSDDELAESPVFSSLVEEKDVAADR